MAIYALIADRTKLRAVFNAVDNERDNMLLFPFDITEKPDLMHRFGKGRLVSYEYDEAGRFRVANDCDPRQQGASMFFVKNLVFKRFNEMTEHDIRCIDAVNPSFADNYAAGRVRIAPDTIVTLIRFNLQQTLHFIPTSDDGRSVRVLH